MNILKPLFHPHHNNAYASQAFPHQGEEIEISSTPVGED